MVETETLRRMYIDEGLPASQISSITGLTHNAIIGRLDRAGFRKDRKPPKMRVHRTSHKKKPSRLNFVFGGGDSKPPERLPDEPTAQDGFRSLNLLELGADDCRWPQGDGPFVFCGCPVRTRPYCSYHERHARPTYGRPAGT